MFLYLRTLLHVLLFIRASLMRLKKRNARGVQILILVLPMLFKLIGRSLHFNLHRDSLFEDVCDKDDYRYNYY